MSPCGFMHILHEFMQPKKLVMRALEMKKFQEQNLNHIEEAVRDAAIAFGMAAAVEFKSSSLFPDENELTQCKRKSGSFSEILLKKIKEWLDNNQKDMSFRYYS